MERMAIIIGVQPGGKGKFSVCSLYWNGRLPAIAFKARSYSGVDEVLADIVGVSGEWGELNSVAIAAPLSWSGTPSGWRKCDRQLRKVLPDWVPSTWIRAPNSLPGALSVQGPALTWALAREAKMGTIPAHAVVETHPRACLVHVARDLKTAVLNYRDPEVSLNTRKKHCARLLERITEPGMVRIDAEAPKSADELDALVCSLVALGCAYPETGLVIHELPGGDIRPVGKRSLCILQAFP